ncbi:MAG TPA: type IV pilin protein [Plasticicumulans sp.]|nr:type IV pilin protein [Plasticicumulans sp.]HNO59763.1 type IV pilin protein [Plasticicumulans sp.]
MKPLSAVHRPLPRQTAGFTLMELMITVAIVGILAAIAYPSYQDSVRKSRRGDAKAALLENAGFMERYYSTNFRYTATAGTADCPTLPVQCLPREVASASCGTDTRVYYTIAGTCANLTFTLTATPKPGSPQASDTCGSLTVDQTGARTPTTSGCWQ